jgi:hypothetical protein
MAGTASTPEHHSRLRPLLLRRKPETNPREQCIIGIERGAGYVLTVPVEPFQAATICNWMLRSGVVRLWRGEAAVMVKRVGGFCRGPDVRVTGKLQDIYCKHRAGQNLRIVHKKRTMCYNFSDFWTKLSLASFHSLAFAARKQLV